MTINIDFANPYVILTVFFFGALFFLDVALKLKIVTQQRQLLKLKQRPPSTQLETALQVIDNVIQQYERMSTLLVDERAQTEAECYIKRMKNLAASLKRDAGL